MESGSERSGRWREKLARGERLVLLDRRERAGGGAGGVARPKARLVRRRLA